MKLLMLELWALGAQISEGVQGRCAIVSWGSRDAGFYSLNFLLPQSGEAPKSTENPTSDLRSTRLMCITRPAYLVIYFPSSDTPNPKPTRSDSSQ